MSPLSVCVCSVWPGKAYIMGTKYHLKDGNFLVRKCFGPHEENSLLIISTDVF